MFEREVMRILRREPRKRGQRQQQPNLRARRFTAGLSFEVVDMCTSPKRKRPDVVHLAQQ